MMHLSRLFQRKKNRKQAAENILAEIMLKSRQPFLFGEERFADSLDGRFECVTIHAVLVIRRLRAAGPNGHAIAKALSDQLFDSFDYALREDGAGDLTIARRIRKLGENYLGRAKAYDSALKEDAPSLGSALKRNLHDVVGSDSFYPFLSDYMLRIVSGLDEVSDDSLLDGRLGWAVTENAAILQ